MKCCTAQGGDKLTLNLNGNVTSPSPVSQLLASPTTPKVCNLPSLIPPLTPTPISLIEKNSNKNESVTVTHFSDLHGGVVEKISVPVTSSSYVENGGDRKMQTTTVRAANNPFADEILTTTFITTSTTSTSPTIKISTNPFLRSSFNANERIDNITDKSVKISFAIGGKGGNTNGNRNPFNISDTSDEMNGSDTKISSEDSNLFNGSDDVDSNENNLSSISSVNLKIDMNNETNVTKIQMETNNLDAQKNGGIKKVCWSFSLSISSNISILNMCRKFVIVFFTNLFVGVLLLEEFVGGN